MNIVVLSPAARVTVEGARAMRESLAADTQKLNAVTAFERAKDAAESAGGRVMFPAATGVMRATTAEFLFGLQNRAANVREADLYASLQDRAEHLEAISKLPDVARIQHDGVVQLLGAASVFSSDTRNGLREVLTPIRGGGSSAFTSGASWSGYSSAYGTETASGSGGAVEQGGGGGAPEPEPDPTPHFMGYVLGDQITSNSEFLTGSDKTVSFVSAAVMIEYEDDDAVLNGDEAVNEVGDDANQYVYVNGTRYLAAIDYLVEHQASGAVFAVIDYDANNDGVFDDGNTSYQDGKILVQLSGPVPTDGTDLVLSPSSTSGIDTAYADLPQSS